MDAIRRQFRSAGLLFFASRVVMALTSLLIVELMPARVFAQGTWTEYPGLPDTRYGSALTFQNDQADIAGGLSPSTGYLKSVYACQACSSTSNGWEPKPNMPNVQFAAAYASGVSASTNLPTLYVAGGNNGSGPVATLSSMHAPSAWSTLTSMPTARQAPAGAFNGGFFYVMGGNTGSGVTGVLEVYNTSSNSWTSAASMPTPRSDLGADQIGGVIYAAGGSDSSSPALATLEAYDPTTNTWVTKASMPTARADLAVVALNGLLFAIGGRGADGTPLSTVEAYDPLTDSWTTESSMPTARWGLAAVVAPESEARPGPNTIWAIGGAVDAAGNTATGVNEVFLPPCGTVDVMPTSLTFNNIGTQSVMLTNTGSLSVGIAGILVSPSGGPFLIPSDACSGSNVAPGASCTIQVNYNGSDGNGTLMINDSACNTPQTVALQATCAGTLNVTPASLSFSKTSTKTVTVTNAGPTNVAISGAMLNPGGGPFSIPSRDDTCSSTTLTPSVSCKVAVRFTLPRKTAGPFNSTLTITDGACGSPQTVSLTGQ